MPKATQVDHKRVCCRYAVLAAGALLTLDGVLLLVWRASHAGVLLPLALGLTFLVIAWRWSAIQQRLAGSTRLRLLWRGGWAALGLGVLVVAGYFIQLAQHVGQSLTGFVPQYIVILGSSTPSGQPSPTLVQRLEQGLLLAAQYPQATVVVSGGRDRTEQTPEAQVMGDYLRGRGLAPERIVQEMRSTSTYENLVFTQALLAERGAHPTDNWLIVTSDFHTQRAGWIARQLGIANARTAAAPTPLYIRYNAWLRELLAVMAGRMAGEF